MIVNQCCYNCKYLYHEGGSSYQPYPEIICGKGHWDGVSNTDELFEEISCIDFKNKL